MKTDEKNIKLGRGEGDGEENQDIKKNRPERSGRKVYKPLLRL